MTRLCDTCRRHRPLCDFDLDLDDEGSRAASCRNCSRETETARELLARRERRAQLGALERRRRRMIAELVRIDAKIAELRASSGASSRARVVLDASSELTWFDAEIS